MADLRPAATVLLCRDTPRGPEVWLMERSRSVAFMASAWVFPGGRVDEADAAHPVEGADVSVVPAAFWAAAARELEEEAGVRLDRLDGMRIWSHWITPEIEPRRYDTWFFAARLPEGAEAAPDGQEAVNGRWFRPQDAVDACLAGELPLAPPTFRTLFELAPFSSVEAILTTPRHTPPIMPCFQHDGATLWVLLPGDPDHPSSDRVDPPHRYSFDLGRWWKK